MINSRIYTNLIVDLIEEQTLDAKEVLIELLGYISEHEAKQFYKDTYEEYLDGAEIQYEEDEDE